MKTVYKHQIYMGTIGDMKNLEHHYARMAEQGWMIDKIGILTHRYRRIEPCKKSFFVDFLPQIAAFDYPENEDAQDYRSLCEASGWSFITANRQFHVFSAEDDTAVAPIHTDNAIQAKIHLKASRKYELPFMIYAVIVAWLFSPLGRGVELFLSNIMLFMTLGYLFFSLGFLWSFGFIIRWQIRTKKSAKESLPLPIVHYRMARARNWVLTTGIILFFLCNLAGVILDLATGLSPYIVLIVALPILGVVTGLWIRRQIDTKKRTRGGNIRLAVAALVVMELVILVGMGFTVRGLINVRLYPDTLGDRPALTLRDFGNDTAPESNNAIVKGSVAVPENYSYWEVGKGGSVHTEKYRSVSSALSQSLYKHLSQDFTKEYNQMRSYGSYEGIDITYLSSAEAAVWGADEGLAIFAEYSMELLLHRGKTNLRLSIGIDGMSVEKAGEVVQGLWGN